MSAAPEPQGSVHLETVDAWQLGDVCAAVGGPDGALGGCRGRRNDEVMRAAPRSATMTVRK